MLQTGGSRVRFPMVPLGVFHLLKPFGRTMALGSSQPLTEMSTRDVSWGVKAAGVGLTALSPPCADCLEILVARASWSPLGPVQSCNGIASPLRLVRMP